MHTMTFTLSWLGFSGRSDSATVASAAAQDRTDHSCPWRIAPYAATFVPANYIYPVNNLEEPRHNATWQLKHLPEDALLIAEWRALYTMYYLAHVEGQRPDITIKEASPHGAREGLVADSLIRELKDALREGRPVYAERVYRNLRDHFRVQPALGGKWYSLSLP